ncbi:MAG: aminotransferase class I/II-fold pyridoxal phosphate-dependent enzyme [Muribaculaceae bacterium]|nr:aminotransferase class I/II-fold pyridoxal phosphate-dependent enzyme [Muribaculaceae bacterium]
MIDGHGDDVFRYGGKVKVNFSTNIHQGVDHSGLMRHLASCPGLLSNYPEPEPFSVENKLGEIHGIQVDNIIVTNGATDAIYLIARKMQGAISAVIVPTFREYQDACVMFGHDIRFFLESEVLDGTLYACNADVVWICNPNNPTGRVVNREGLLKIIDSKPETLFVIDQAYADYSVVDVLTVHDVLSRKNVIMLQSLTKRFAVPGLRIGYAVAASEIISGLRSMRMPWSVNSFAIEASHYLFEHKEAYHIDKNQLHEEAVGMSQALRRLGIECNDTDCNFVLCRLPKGKASQLKEFLMYRYGLLIRDASNFETLDHAYFRVAAQGHESNELLIKCIEEWMSL